MANKAKLLIVDDEKIALRNLQHVLKKEGYDVKATLSGQNALKLLHDNKYDVVLTDLRMEKVDGMQILGRCKELYPETEVIMITGYASIENAIKAMKQGAYHYIAKPFKLDEVKKVVFEAAEKVRLLKENKLLRDNVESLGGKEKIITQDPQMIRILELAREISPTDCNVIITGESGTGKEMIAKYIHNYSKRADKQFIAINCGAFTEELLANELFGHEKDAYTGASKMKKGIIEVASNGTLFLDEITEMSASMQVKFLRVIQEEELYRIGGNSPISVDVRYIAATNRNISESIGRGEMRQDLYYRLNVVTFNIPPLCERPGDIPLLCLHFLNKYSVLMNKAVEDISEEVLDVLMGYNYPGNVRELENIIERGVALCRGNMLEMAHLPDDLKNFNIKTFRKSGGGISSLEDQEKAYISWVLKEVGGNKTKASEILGIDRVSLWRKMKRFGITE
ncbi:MAG: sigma-54-dependent Fis family transcriptional regulator [Nitrospirota bacterium]|nr:MAG: sigma-54-dependent Fis family transcriptional regulator [Nitrospirota bacterium]